MTYPAAIFDGSYADYKHVKTRKVLQIIVEIPAERAKAFFDMFGVPTGADEIPVAIAKMNMNLADASTREDEGGGLKSIASATSAAKPKREMTLANIIGAVCDRPDFQDFLRRAFPEEWGKYSYHELAGYKSKNVAAEIVRAKCGVKTRSDIEYNTPEAGKWAELYNSYAGIRS